MNKISHIFGAFARRLSLTNSGGFFRRLFISAMGVSGPDCVTFIISSLRVALA